MSAAFQALYSHLHIKVELLSWALPFLDLIESCSRLLVSITYFSGTTTGYQFEILTS